jgi:hypothetical protein
MLRKMLLSVAISAVVSAAVTLPTAMNARAQTIPGISDSELAEAHIVKGCHLHGASATAQKIFGSYALAIEGSGHIPQSFFPNGAPATADVGVVWCRFNRVISETSDFLLIRYQSYSSDYVAIKGFDLAVNAQNKATPGNQYKMSVSGSLTLGVRQYGEVIAVSGPVVASAAWYMPTQQPDMINRNVGGGALVPMMFALICKNAAPKC